LGPELEQASSGLDSFVKRVDQAIIHAQMAIAESQTAAQQIGTLTDDIESALEEECKNPVMKESVSKYIDRSEDLAIESIEELRSTSLLLEKLHQRASMRFSRRTQKYPKKSSFVLLDLTDAC
jgi:hypothetical protein